MQLPDIVPGPGCPNFPRPGPNVPGNAAATAANSGVAFRAWVEEVGRAAGMQVSNQVIAYDGVRREGMWHQVVGHVADKFESLLLNYNWGAVLGQQTAGRYYRMAPSGAGRATITSKHILPFR